MDFLKYVRFRTSQIIHIQDEEIKFQKEILFECLDISTLSQEDSLPLKEVSSLIFENSEKKNREMKGERKKTYKSIKKIIQNEINQIQDEEEEETVRSANVSQDEEEEEEEEEDENKRKKSKFLGLIPAIASVIIFILTEDMRNPMRLTDRYTLLMVIVALLNFVLAFLTRNKKKDDDEEEDEDDQELKTA